MGVSTHEIIVELSKLDRSDLEVIDAKLHELLKIENRPAKPKAHWGEALAELVGSVKDLPADYARNHDHYLHGAPKQR